MRRALQLGAVVAVLAGGGQVGRAQPVTLEVTGGCPSLDQVERALAAEGVAATSGPAPVQVWVWSGHGSATLDIGSADRSELRRTVKGGDCAAIADTFALIASVHLRSRTEPQPPVAPPAPPAAPADRPLAPSFGPPGASASLERSARPIPRRGGRRAWLGITLGLDQSVAPEYTIAFGSAEAGLGLGPRWAARVAVAHHPATSTELILRDETSGRLELLRRTAGRRSWLSPALGVGLAVSTIQPTSGWSQDRVTRLHPVVTGGLQAGYALTPWLAVRAELAVEVFPIADIYTSETLGEYGHSPRAIGGFGIGLEIGRVR